MRKEIQALLIEAIQEQDLYLDQPVDMSAGGDTILYAEDGQLDSLSLITIIADMEKQISNRFGVKLRLANERDLSTHNSPFTTFSKMHNFIVDKLEAALQVSREVA
ncbi:hypothetical protein [Pseudoalteromonas sp. S16_S37]|uniref:hypothetical protein n=1 Tax=Pseudoalteromonas sp. S16_S37 TaxID=2720228 RepID=UPI00167FFF87|nr:hypothetical protein [Pseudoalteromonas sp. S16_S37]MBD1582317.1 hypothetical protein [Pseudoalteromonas sp. S16_S37]